MMRKICKNCIHFEGYDEEMDEYTCFATNRVCTPNYTCELFEPRKEEVPE